MLKQTDAVTLSKQLHRISPMTHLTMRQHPCGYLTGPFRCLAHLLALAIVWLAVGFATASAQTPSMPIEAGHSGAWYNPARNGEGWVLEVNSERSAVIYWYTFENGLPTWMVGTSEFSADATTLTFDAWTGYGGRFGPEFDPDSISLQQRSPITVRFVDCNHGEVEHLGRVYPVERLTPILGTSCGGTSSTPAPSYAGQTGAWFNPSRDGEGFSLQWWAEDQAIVTWYTYDPDGAGQPIWIVGAGRRVGDAIEFPELFTARGAQFGAAFDPTDVELSLWGSLRLELNCGHGLAHYEGRAPYGSGDIGVTQLTSIANLNTCSSARSLTDLYEISFEELPADGNVQLGRDRNAVTNDGMLYGTDADHRLVRSTSLDGTVEVLAEGPVGSIFAINHDGSRIVLNSAEVYDGNTYVQVGPRTPVLWTAEAGLQPLDVPYEDAWVTAVSQDLRSFAGVGSRMVGGGEEREPWALSASGLRTLSVGNFYSVYVRPTAISNDGTAIFGAHALPYPGLTGAVVSALQWREDEHIRILTDPYQQFVLGPITVCDANCELHFGAGVADDSSDLAGKRMWRGQDGNFTSWARLPDDAITGDRMWPVRRSDDGSLVIGRYFRPNGPSNPFPGRSPFVWTPETDTTALFALLLDLGLTDSNWGSMDVIAVSPNGEHLLVVGSAQVESGANGWVIPQESRFARIRLRRR